MRRAFADDTFALMTSGGDRAGQHQVGVELFEGVDVAGNRVALQGAEAGFAAQFRREYRLVPEHR